MTVPTSPRGPRPINVSPNMYDDAQDPADPEAGAAHTGYPTAGIIWSGLLLLTLLGGGWRTWSRARRKAGRLTGES